MTKTENDMPRIYGYVRVSSMDQNEDRQMIALRQAGVEDRYKTNKIKLVNLVEFVKEMEDDKHK